MKKIFILFVVLFASMNVALAKFITQPESVKIQKVSELQHLKDDQAVILKGNIIKQINEETYLFSDGTGTIVLDIDEDVWKGNDVTATDVVRIHGEFDKHLLKDSEIDVDIIEVVVPITK